MLEAQRWVGTAVLSGPTRMGWIGTWINRRPCSERLEYNMDGINSWHVLPILAGDVSRDWARRLREERAVRGVFRFSGVHAPFHPGRTAEDSRPYPSRARSLSSLQFHEIWSSETTINLIFDEDEDDDDEEEVVGLLRALISKLASPWRIHPFPPQALCCAN